MRTSRGTRRPDQNRLGFMYFRGEEVPENLITAYMWFNLAAGRGSGEASEMIYAVRESMTTEQLAEAHWLSLEWLEEHPEARYFMWTWPKWPEEHQ